MAAENLRDNIDTKQSYCLNQHPSHPMANLFMGDETLFLKSDCDNQLLICIVFRQTVKLSSICVGARPNEFAPTSIKLYSNLLSPGFSDVENHEPAQTIELDPETLTPDRKISLKVVKFQYVNNLTIFIDSNAGGDSTELFSLSLFGNPVAMACGELKKCCGDS